MKRLLMLSTLAIVLSSGCAKEPGAPEPIIRPVRYLQVYKGSQARSRSFSGTAQASVESRLSFKVSGTIERLNVSMGDRVSAGQLLAALDAKDYELKVNQTAASYEQAVAQQRNAAADYRRVLALYENNNASRNDLDGARAGRESADAQVRSLENSLELARLQLSYARLVAPVDGSVVSVPVEANENVQAGQNIVTLTAGVEPEVVIGVPEQIISKIREGDLVSVGFDAIDGRQFAATVTEVAVQPSAASSTFEVRARLDESSPDIRSGMACEVVFEFPDGTGSDHFLLPPIAVREDRDGRFVYVVELGEDETATARRRVVEVGELRSDGIEVVTGLSDGELVVTAGVSKIHDGLAVKLLSQ